MALKIRLRQQGRKNSPFYRLVVADGKSPRDGKYLEAVGWYNPFEEDFDKGFFVKPDRVQHWLDLGAQFTESAQTLVKRAAPSITTAQVQAKLSLRSKAREKAKAKRRAVKEKAKV